MKRLFGTDGVRGVAGEPPLDPASVRRDGGAQEHEVELVAEQGVEDERAIDLWGQDSGKIVLIEAAQQAIARDSGGMDDAVDPAETRERRGVHLAHGVRVRDIGPAYEDLATLALDLP